MTLETWELTLDFLFDLDSELDLQITSPPVSKSSVSFALSEEHVVVSRWKSFNWFKRTKSKNQLPPILKSKVNENLREELQRLGDTESECDEHEQSEDTSDFDAHLSKYC